MNDEREIYLYAEEMYRYLFLRRMGTQESRPMQTKPNDVRHYTNDVGKAVLVTCSVYQDQFWEEFINDMFIITKDIDSCIHYCFQTALRIYKETEDVFESLTRVGAMILELVTFCCWNYLEDFRKHASTCWVEIFQHNFKWNFFKNGGWQIQRERARKFKTFYDSRGFEKPLKSEYILIDRSWLMRFDRNMFEDQSVAIASVSNIIIVPECDVAQLDSRQLPQQETGFSSDDLITKELIELFKPENTEVEIPCDFGSSQTEENVGARMDDVLDLNVKSVLLKKTESVKQLEAVPKNRQITDEGSKTSTTVASSSNSEFLDCFMNIIIRTDDMPGKELYEIISVNGNEESILNNINLYNTTEDTAELPERNRNNSRLLAIVITLVSESNPTGNGQIFKRLLPQTYETSKIKSTVEVKSVSDQHSNIEVLESVPILHSSPNETTENMVDEGLIARGKTKLTNISNNKDFYSRNELASKISYPFGYTRTPSKNKDLITEKIENIYRSLRNLKIDSTENTFAPGYFSPKTESSTNRCKNGNKTITQEENMEALRSFDRLTRRMTKIEHTAQHSSDLVFIKVLKLYSSSLDKVETFDINIKIQIVKSLLREMSDFNSKKIYNIIQLSRPINTLSRTPEQKAYAAVLERSIVKFLKVHKQATRYIADNCCDCCVCEKMEICQKLVETACNLDAVEIRAKVKLVHYRMLNIRSE